MNLIFTVKNGKPYFGRQNVALVFNKKNEGKKFEIRKLSGVRSDRQNRYYWAYLHLIEQETGNLAEEMHEIFKRLFLEPKTIIAFKHRAKVPGSTTKLSKTAFSDYIAKIENLTGIPAPDPEEWRE